MGRERNKKGNSGRDAGGFTAIPWTVFDSPAYAQLSHPAKALLMEFARQFKGGNNGKLLCSSAYLRPRGWKSCDVITRAKADLLKARFIFETCKGHRPNHASWYAVTWQTLDRHQGYDHGAIESFERSAYRKNAPLIPSPGVGRLSIAPSRGVGKPPSEPSPGAIKGSFDFPSMPSPGNHLEKPSPGATQRQDSASKEVMLTDQTTATAYHPQALRTLADLWARVGIRAMALPKTGRAGAVATNGRRDRLSVARAAQVSAMARHAHKPAPVLANAEDERIIDRTEAQDLHAWND